MKETLQPCFPEEIINFCLFQIRASVLSSAESIVLSGVNQNAHIHPNAPEYSFQFLRVPRDPQEVSCCKRSPLLRLQLKLLFVVFGLEA